MPRLAHGALPGTGGPLRRGGPSGAARRVYQKGLPERQAGPPPGRGGGRPAGGRDAGGRPRGGGTALRGPVPAGGGGLPRSGGPAGTFPRRIGLSRRGHRPSGGRADRRRALSRRRGAAAPAGNLPAGAVSGPGGALRHCGPSQRGQVLSPERLGGLSARHRHRYPGHHPGHGGGAVHAGRRTAAAHRYGRPPGDRRPGAAAPRWRGPSWPWC